MDNLFAIFPKHGERAYPDKRLFKILKFVLTKLNKQFNIKKYEIFSTFLGYFLDKL